MDFGRIWAGLSDDPAWLNKLGMAALVTLLAVITTPLIIGLLGWAILLGYQAQTVRRVRQKEALPLPAWNDPGALMRLGLPALGAWIIYLLPNLLVGACVVVMLISTNGTSFASTGVVIGLFCCLVPLLVLYNILTVPLFALGLGRYASDPVIGVFFDFSRLWGELSANWGLTGMYLVYNIGFSFVSGVLGAIPVIGWLIILGIEIPVRGLIDGQYALAAQGPIAPPKKSSRAPR